MNLHRLSDFTGARFFRGVASLGVLKVRRLPKLFIGSVCGLFGPL